MGYYKVHLDDTNIDVELTATTRVGFHRYTFNDKGKAHILLDLNHRDYLLEGEIKVLDEHKILVKRRSKAWAQNQYVFALIEFNEPVKLKEVISDKKSDDVYTSREGNRLMMVIEKKVKSGAQLLVKVSLSFTGYEGAQKNSREIVDWDFDRVKQEAKAIWNMQLSKIDIKTDDQEQKTIFYTALYHTMLQPNIAEDVDGQYRGMDQNLHMADDFDYYTVFSLWDTFRATHPLYTLIERERTVDFIRTMLVQYEQSGRLPVWELASNETDCMIGYHAVSVMADAMVKGITGFDYQKAMEAAIHSATLDHLGLDAYQNNAQITVDDEHESVSKNLEYCYDDWCIAMMALQLDDRDTYRVFVKRSQYWKNLFDTETGFIRSKQNGGWQKPFDPKEVNNNYTEGNCWQYTFFVPHDIPGMVEAYGGSMEFEQKLDILFNTDSQTTGRHQVDITGLIGQYAHGNEPSHHIAYLYNAIGKPGKTQRLVDRILKDFYKNAPDGLIGNEDCGQMSAWYVLSSLGLYQINPGGEEWQVIKPQFEATMHFEDGTSQIINEQTDKNILKRLGYKTTPNNVFQYKYPIVIVPTIEASSNVFETSLPVTLNHKNTGVILEYAVEREDMPLHFQLYKNQPIYLTETATVHVRALKGQYESKTVKAKFYKKPNNYTVELLSAYNPQYHGGGALGLVDGVKGDTNWKKGGWQGYQDTDFIAVVDLQQSRSIHHITTTFLQDTRAWILMPTQVNYYVSQDGQDFTPIGSVANTVDYKNYEVMVHPFTLEVSDQTARYLKVEAKNYGLLPEWHQGYPYEGKAFIFVDEVEVE